MTNLGRRDFLAAAGGLLASTIAGCGAHPFGTPLLRRRKGAPLAGKEDYVPSNCLQCPAGCGTLVRRVDGVPVQIKGNPAYPTNAGGLCPKGVAGLQVLYDPDRIKGPLRRVGTRGAGNWRPIPWDEAIRAVAEKLASLREKPGPQSVVFLGGRYQGSMHPLVQQFLRAYGSPNDLGNGSVGSDGTKVALEMTQGVHDYPGFDWEHTNYVMSFGASWLEAYRPTTYLLRAFAHLRRGRAGIRAKLVHVDTRFSVTSAKADEWICIRPGTDAALALAIAHVIVKEELWNRGFVAERTFGFEDWEDESGPHIGFRRFVLENYPPGKAAEITGVPADRIERIAREFAAQSPAFAVGERGTSMQSNGLYTRIAVHALNALVGSINRPGGVLVQQDPPLRAFPDPKIDEVARRGLEQPRIDGAGTRRYPLAREVSQALPDGVLDGHPYPVEACFLYYTNPLFSRTNGEDFRRAFERIPFLVSFSPFLDDSTRFADLVLPDHTFLERWQEVSILPSVGYPVVGVRQPVTEPLYDTRHSGDVILAIAHALGGSVADSLPWHDYRELMEYRLGGMSEREGGSVTGSSEQSFVRNVERAGGWWDPQNRFLPWEQVFRTPSGRYEFYSTAMRARLRALLRPGETTDDLLAELGVAARGDEGFLPHYEPPRFHGDEAEFPLHLNTYKPMARAEGRGGNQPYLQEIMGLHVREAWATWVEMNPVTAHELGIRDGDMVWVESPRGRIKVKARHYPGARPDVVNMPFDAGHRGYGRWAEATGVNPNEIMIRDDDRIVGQAAYYGTRVRIRRA